MNWTKKSTVLMAALLMGAFVQQTLIADLGFHLGGDGNDDGNGGIGFHIGSNAYKMGQEDRENGEPRRKWTRPWKQEQYDRGYDGGSGKPSGKKKTSKKSSPGKAKKAQKMKQEQEESNE